MNIQSELNQCHAQQLTRRALLGRSTQGLGALALATLLAPRTFASASKVPPMRGIFSAPPLPQRAKRVIWLSMAGGPSHLETFDPKPKPAELNGQPMPESMTRGQQLAQL